MTNQLQERAIVPNVDLDQELEQILKLGEEGIDRETQQFIDEVLKFVPEEPAPEYHIITSHDGAIDASEN